MASEPPPYSPVDPMPMDYNVNVNRRAGRASYHGGRQPSSPQDVGASQAADVRRVQTTAAHYPSHSMHTQTSPTVPTFAPPPGAPPTRQPTVVNSPPTRQGTLSTSPTMARNRQEDLLRQLSKFDTVIIVDDSSSMAGPLWFEAREALVQLAEMAGRYDTDGLDVHFLNSEISGQGLRPADVKRLFDQVEPDGITPTGEKLEALLLDYLLRLEHAKAEADRGDPSLLKQVKPVNYLVITDGAPSDDPETVIMTAAKRLDQGKFPLSQVGIQFVQIGSDPDATEALRELDDDLAGRYGCRDIVDTTLFTGEQLDGPLLSKILLGGINKRVDRRGVA